MSSEKIPPVPSAGGGGKPAGCTTEPCPLKCWTDDYEKVVSVEPCGRYFKQFKADGTVVTINGPVSFKILAPVKSGPKITVEVRFKAEADAGVSATDIAAAKTKLEAGVNTHWNGKFTLQADDPDCGKKTFPIAYKVLWVDSGEDYTLKIHATHPREGVTGNVVDVSKSTTAWTYAHEFGHTVGLPDEYSYSADTEQVKYIKPGSSLDAAISAPPNGKPANAPDATIMSAVNNNTTLKRHAWNIAIEVQELLTAKLGRQIKCDII